MKTTQNSASIDLESILKTFIDFTDLRKRGVTKDMLKSGSRPIPVRTHSSCFLF